MTTAGPDPATEPAGSPATDPAAYSATAPATDPGTDPGTNSASDASDSARDSAAGSASDPATDRGTGASADTGTRRDTGTGTGTGAGGRTVVQRRPGAYRDSVTLMQVSRTLSGLAGVHAAMVAMATPLNLGILADAGFTVPDGAGPTDLVVAIRAADPVSLQHAQAVADRALADRSAAGLTGLTRPAGPAGPAGLPGPAGPTGLAGTGAPARTVGSAARRSGGGPGTAGVGVAVVSVPGRYAFVEAMDALESGLHVMVFSDNVPLDEEIRLKDEAARRGLLVMGPDCGTAVVGGVGLGFANATSPGPVGVVAASGTGAQHLVCLLDAAGVGVRHVLGTGGRDLSGPVRARSTLPALAALDADPATELVVVVSKPPAAEVAELVLSTAAGCATPVLPAFLGPGREDLTGVAGQVLRALDQPVPSWPQWPVPTPRVRRGSALRGLFCGGTLCGEAMVIASGSLGPVRSNIPLEPGWALPPDRRAGGHLMIDFGAAEFTSGRPHPMIDPSTRIARLHREAADPDTGVLLLDVVLGYGSHPDPAAELAPAVRSARDTATGAGRDLAVVVSLSGTRTDPQGTEAQAEALQAAGAHVFGSNAEATRHAVALVTGG